MLGLSNVSFNCDNCCFRTSTNSTTLNVDEKDLSSAMKKDAIVTIRGKIAVIRKTFCAVVIWSNDPLKYAERIPPTAAAPQQRLCKSPETEVSDDVSSVPAETRLRSTTIESATTSLIATDAEPKTIAAIAEFESVTNVPSASQERLPKIPERAKYERRL